MYKFHWKSVTKAFNSKKEFEEWIDSIDLYNVKSWWVEYEERKVHRKGR